jgi:hypothetical protein
MAKSKEQKRVGVITRLLACISNTSSPNNVNTRELTRAYLIQRAEIIHPYQLDGVLSKAVNFDYMGSSEFEFGALPASLRELQAEQEFLKLEINDDIRDEQDRPLIVLHTVSTENWKKYRSVLLLLREGKYQTKEITKFEADNPFKFIKSDFWWDVNNSIMWSFDSKFMTHLVNILKNSWIYMDSMKKA